MKLTIHDQDAMQTLSPIDVRAYLINQGWTDVGRIGDKASIYTQTDNDGRQWEILLPIRTDVADYAERMAETVSTVARLEARSEIEIYADFIAAGNDIIRLRAPEADEQGTIALQDGVALYQQAQNLMLAAACAAVQPRRSYHARKINEAVSYLDEVRLGQTEHGSYVLTIYSPVSPALRRVQQPLHQDFETDPFSRLVTRKLAEALKAIRVALNEAIATDAFDAFEQAIKHGVSANLCEAIAGLTHHGDGLDISMTWARVRPAPEPNMRYQFTVAGARILEEAAREFRRNEPILEETVTGFVIALDRAPEEFDGNATIQVVLNNRPRRIRIQFGKDDYNTVIQAFQEKLPVSLEGDIYPVGQRFELRNLQSLMLLTDMEGESI